MLLSFSAAYHTKIDPSITSTQLRLAEVHLLKKPNVSVIFTGATAMMRAAAPPGASDAGLRSDQQVTIPADGLIDITAEGRQAGLAPCKCMNLCERLTKRAAQRPPLSLAKLAAFLFASPMRVIHDVQITPSKRRDCEQARAV